MALRAGIVRWALVFGPVAAFTLAPLRAGAQDPNGGPRYEEGLIRIEDLVRAVDGAGPGAPVAASAPAELPTSEARAAGMDALRRGVEASSAGEMDGAVREFERAGVLLPVMADWADLLAARAIASTGDVDRTRRLVEGIPATGAGEWAWRATYDAMLIAGDSAGAIAVADRAATESGTAPERALASARAGALRLTRGDSAAALAAFRTAMRESATSGGGLEAARGAHDLSGLTADDKLLIGRTLLAHGGRDRGIPLLESFAAAAGTSPADGAAIRLEAGTVLFNAREYAGAERNLRIAAERLPEAAYMLGRTDYRLGREEQGVRGFQDVARRFPDSAAAADALFVLADLAHDEGRLTVATGYYRQAIATGAHTVYAADSAVRLAGIGLMADDPAAALADVTEYLAGRPRDRMSAPVIYWSGRASEALGRAAEAEAAYREVFDLHPFSYYGMLSARRLGGSLADVALPAPPEVGPAVAEIIETVFFRMDLLREIGLAADASLELARLQTIAGTDPGALYLVAEAMSAHGAPVEGALLGRTIQEASGVWDDRLLRIVFQFPYREIVVAEANRQGLDPYAVAGLIRQESFFNPVAASAAGAVGLMQVMPSTASELARRGGIGGYQSRMLREPATNLRLGTIFLADQMDRWNGRLSDVLGAYNGGPTRVARWSQFPEHRDDEIYIERIPLAETRDYVKRVTLYGEIYRRLYASSSTQPAR